VSQPGATLLVLLVTAALYGAFRWLGGTPSLGVDTAQAQITEGLLKLVLWLAPSALLLRALGARTYGDACRRLGADGRAALAGFRLATIASLPTLALMLSGVRTSFDGVELVTSVVLSPIAEEVLFRGWLFRQLILLARWRPLPAGLVSSIAFGLAHPGYMSDPLAVLTTTGVGLLFAWMVLRWDSLWPAIGLHAAMNFSWAIFGTGRSTAPPGGAAFDGSLVVSLARIATIVIAVALTFLGTRRPAPPAPAASGREQSAARSDRASPGDR
jgi:membrane protease YdiL (CAAX protease family)